MQVLKVDCAATIPPGVMSVTDAEGNELWRGVWRDEHMECLALRSLPSGATIWVSVLDWAERIASGVPRRALH